MFKYYNVYEYFKLIKIVKLVSLIYLSYILKNNVKFIQKQSYQLYVIPNKILKISTTYLFNYINIVNFLKKYYIQTFKNKNETFSKTKDNLSTKEDNNFTILYGVHNGCIECPICQENVINIYDNLPNKKIKHKIKFNKDNREVVQLLKCKHIYHKECIDMWYNQQYYSGLIKCPLCNVESKEYVDLKNDIFEIKEDTY